MKSLLAAVTAALAFTACGLDIDESPEAGTATQPLQTLDLPPEQHPELKPLSELFGVNPALDPGRESFQQHFAYTVNVPH